MRYLRGGLGRAALGLLISAVALALVFRTVDVATAWQTLKTAQWQWIVVLIGLVIADVLLRAVRWRILLTPLGAGQHPHDPGLAQRRLPRQQRAAGPARRGRPRP